MKYIIVGTLLILANTIILLWELNPRKCIGYKDVIKFLNTPIDVNAKF